MPTALLHETNTAQKCGPCATACRAAATAGLGEAGRESRPALPGVVQWGGPAWVPIQGKQLVPLRRGAKAPRPWDGDRRCPLGQARPSQAMRHGWVHRAEGQECNADCSQHGFSILT